MIAFLEGIAIAVLVALGLLVLLIPIGGVLFVWFMQAGESDESEFVGSVDANPKGWRDV